MKEVFIVTVGFTLFVLIAKQVTMFHVEHPVETSVELFTDQEIKDWQPFR